MSGPAQPGDDLPELLERSAAYALGVLAGVDGTDLRRPTPCADWDLGSLLLHLADSVSAIGDGLARGRVALAVPEAGRSDPAASVRTGLGRILGSLPGPTRVAVGDCDLPGSDLTAVAAVEVAVHGWDVAASCGRPAPIPPALAGRLLVIASGLIDLHGRDGRFDPPVAAPVAAAAGDRLVAFLGRHPSR